MAINAISSKDSNVRLIRCLIYGDSGVGKTTAISTLPEGKTLILLTEPKALPLIHKDFLVVPVRNWKELRETVSDLHLMGDKIVVNGRQIRTVAIDSLTEMGEYCKQWIVGTERPNLIRSRTDNKTDKPDKVYDDQMGMEDWGKYRTAMRSMVQSINQMPCNTVFTALADWNVNDQTKQRERTVMLDSKLRRTINASFDVVLYLDTFLDSNGAEVRKFQTFKGDGVLAKAPPILDSYEDPNLLDIFMKVLRGVAPAPPAPPAEPASPEPSDDANKGEEA
jgi:GTPase SAR1 family protein